MALLALMLAAALPVASHAQTYVTDARPILDSRGVDVRTGNLNAEAAPIRVGTLGSLNGWSGVVSFTRFDAYVSGSGDPTIFLFGKSIKFKLVSGIYVPENGDGSTLVKVATAPENYTYTSPEGVVYYFKREINVTTFQPQWGIIRAHLQTVTDPNGRRLTYAYKVANGQEVCLGPTCTFIKHIRVQSVISSDGYMLKPTYVSNAATNNGFERLASVQAINLSEDYCDPHNDSCPGLAKSWPTQTIAETTSGSVKTQTITDQDGNTTEVDRTGDRVTEVTPPPTNQGQTTATYDGSDRVNQVTDDTGTYTYSYSTSGSTQTTTITGPGATTETYVVDTTISRPTSITDAMANTTSYQYDTAGRKTRETYPEGNYTQWTYDARGNVTEVRRVAKAGSGLADIVSTASFDATCANPKKCNKPNYTVDERGKRTDFTYDATHGGVTRIQLPAPNGSSPRPEINYSYTLLTGKIRNSSGLLVPVTSSSQYLLTQITTCATAATCAGTANETKVTIAYATSNLKPSSVTTAAGDGSISSTAAYTYDHMANIASVDGPLPGSDDTTYYFYGINNLPAGIIGPDPDGAGSRPRQAVRHSYLNLRLVKTEFGTVTGTTVAALNTITPTQTINYTLDTKGRKIKEVVSGTAGAVSVAQYSYDSKDRLWCTALRMNPATWASLPADACTAATTSTTNGPDRITRNSYDAKDRVTKVESAVGTTASADEVRAVYTANGQISYVIDAESNRTTYIYDGHDRLSQTRYPSSTKGADTSNASDYEQLGYDAANNIISRRLRDGTSIAYGYDDLGRMTAIDLPNTVFEVLDKDYEYDLMGRLTAATMTNGWNMSFVYDALGRQVQESAPLGNIARSFDAAGRMTSETLPGGGLTINYDYDVTGNVTAVRENGATSGVGVLASYSYDSLGRRSSVTLGNGVSHTYGYDPASRPSSLSGSFPVATVNNFISSFTYNPASQIASTTRGNDSYAWTNHYNVDRNYTVNGLNQMTAAGAAALGYDARGNLTTSGSNSYSYGAENLLATSSVGGINRYMSYDAVGRFVLLMGDTSNSVRFDYSGSRLISERDWYGNLLRRYVHGPGADEPIVWYEGAGTSDRRFLTRDERGSIINVSDGTGATLARNSYDEYGIPAPGNLGRFGYTGQAWLPEVGLWYYKARMYSPTLGRFMQTDPIGYADGMNWYNYVGGDPVNFNDPLGLCSDEDPSKCDGPPIVVRAKKKRSFCDNYPNDNRCGGGGGVPSPSSPSGANLPQKPLPNTCPSGTFYTGNEANGAAICAALPAPKQPSFLEQCMAAAKENFQKGETFSGERFEKQSGRGLLAIIKNPIQSGGMNGGAYATASAGAPLYDLGYFFGRSCPKYGK